MTNTPYSTHSSGTTSLNATHSKTPCRNLVISPITNHLHHQCPHQPPSTSIKPSFATIVTRPFCVAYNKTHCPTPFSLIVERTDITDLAAPCLFGGYCCCYKVHLIQGRSWRSSTVARSFCVSLTRANEAEVFLSMGYSSLFSSA